MHTKGLIGKTPKTRMFCLLWIVTQLSDGWGEFICSLVHHYLHFHWKPAWHQLLFFPYLPILQRKRDWVRKHNFEKRAFEIFILSCLAYCSLDRLESFQLIFTQLLWNLGHRLMKAHRHEKANNIKKGFIWDRALIVRTTSISNLTSEWCYYLLETLISKMSAP